MLATALVTIWAVREPDHTEPVTDTGFLKTYRETLTMPVFLKALIPWTLFITGTTMIQGALVYFFKYIYLDEGLFQLALMFLLAFSLICIPLWVRLSQRFGKKGCYNAGMLIMSVAVLSFVVAGDRLGPIWAFITMAVGGVGLSTHYVMPHSILPDIVEYDALNHDGQRREGVFSSLWTFSSKLGQAVALALTGWILGIFQYDPLITPDTQVLFGIKILCGPVPVLFYLAGIIILSTYPISRDFYNRMFSQRGEMSKDPLPQESV